MPTKKKTNKKTNKLILVPSPPKRQRKELAITISNEDEEGTLPNLLKERKTW